MPARGRLQSLQGQLLTGRLDIGHYRFFEVFDPKRRSICAAGFPERVLHHAVMNLCEPVLDARMIHDSYACRKNKGPLMALNRCWRSCRLFSKYLKLDIKKYFDSIDHNIAMEQLKRTFKDRELLDLFDKVLDTYHTEPGKGIPIGNLISQHLANFYLSPFDHWVKEERSYRGYVRYMDDFILFADDVTVLKAELARIEKFLAERLGLKVKENVQLNRCKKGIPFLGFRVFPQTIRLSPRSRKRFVVKLKKYEKKRREGEMSDREAARRTRSLIEFTRAAHSIEFRRKVLLQ